MDATPSLPPSLLDLPPDSLAAVRALLLPDLSWDLSNVDDLNSSQYFLQSALDEPANFAAAVGVAPLPEAKDPKGATADVTFGLPSRPEDPYKVGEQVVVARRFTRTVPIKGDPKFRTDVREDEEAL